MKKWKVFDQHVGWVITDGGMWSMVMAASCTETDAIAAARGLMDAYVTGTDWISLDNLAEWLNRIYEPETVRVELTDKLLGEGQFVQAGNKEQA